MSPVDADERVSRARLSALVVGTFLYRGRFRRAVMSPSPTLLADAALASVAAGLYGYVGRLVHRRPVATPQSQFAQRAFVVWWYGLAVLTALGALRSVLGALGHAQLETYLAITHLTVPLIVVALWGLLYYLTFIHTGKPRLLVPVTAFHAVLFAFYTYLVIWLHPTGVDIGRWDVSLRNEREIEGPLAIVVYGTLVGPVLLAAAAYFTLFFRTDDPLQRYRIALVSGSFLGWFGVVLLAAVFRISDDQEWWPIAGRLIAIGATWLLVMAFRPPRWVRRRLGLAGAYG